MPMTPRFALLLCALALASGPQSAYATANDPAVAQVQTLTDALLKSMRAGATESMTERYRDLEPVIEQVFALPLMTRLSVGPAWAGFQPEQQKALVAAFSRYTIANYAHNFHSFDGQKFEVDENALSRGDEKIVRSRLIPRDDAPANLLYRILEVNGVWKIVDVYYNGVSQLTLHRVDFAGAIGAGGAPVLLAHLNHLSDDLMR
jgi:phospholipid transport system substrate-binding protein